MRDQKTSELAHGADAHSLQRLVRAHLQNPTKRILKKDIDNQDEVNEYGRMKVTFSIATPSGVKVLGTSNGRQVRFSAAAFKLGYAAMMLKRAVLAQCAYLAAEPAAVSVETICGIKIERVA